MKVIVRRLARRDIAEAVRWYRTRSEGVARVFLDALEARLVAIEQTPERFPIVHADVRRALVGRFHTKADLVSRVTLASEFLQSHLRPTDLEGWPGRVLIISDHKWRR